MPELRICVPEGEEDTQQRVLEAAFELFLERGRGGYTLHDVAARAGTDAAVIAGWGYSYGTLNADAVTNHMGPPPPCPDTGSLRTDLAWIARTVVGRMQAEPRLLARTIEAFRHPHYVLDDGGRVDTRLEVYRPVFERAVARGEILAGYDLRGCVELLLARVWARWLDGRSFDIAECDELAELTLVGIAAEDHERETHAERRSTEG